MNDTIQFKRQGKLKEIWRRLKKSKTAMFGLVVLSIFIFSAVFAEFITPYNTAIKQNIRQRMQGPSTDHCWHGRIRQRCVRQGFEWEQEIRSR